MYLNIHRRSALLCLNPLIFSQTLKHYPLFNHYPSLSFCTNTSNSPSFPVSYLISNFGFSPKSASKLCSTYRLGFKTPKNPDSVLTFFRNRGFSDTQLHHMIQKAPWLLSSDPCKRLLPKFEFFQSKGASTSDIVNLVSKYPIVLSPSLEKQIVPAYELTYRFLQSDKDTIALLNGNPTLFNDIYLARNIRVLIENGVNESKIAKMFRIWSKVFNIHDNKMLKLVMEVKDMGFDPSKSTFATALMAKVSVSTTLWNEKSDAFKKWGWSDEDILVAFRRHPECMLASVDKIDSVMSFWVNHLGWDALELAKVPRVIGRSLKGRIIPRAAVLQFLMEKGLRKKNASLTYPFQVTEKLFRNNFIKQYAEYSSVLLKLYEEKLNPSSSWENTGMP